MTAIELEFRPGVQALVEIDERNLLFCAEQRSSSHIPDQARIIEQALDHPIASPPLQELLSTGSSGRKPKDVVILVDDITRPTPTDRILPHILERIRTAGLADEAVSIFIAMGTHRRMTDAEIRLKLGTDIPRRYRVINRDYQTADFVPLGSTPSGIPIHIDRQVVQSDLKIAVGNVVPHVSAGWGGGSKIILPGVCSRETSDRMHLMACLVQPVLEVLGQRDNKPRAEMDAIAERLGLDFIINTVLDPNQNILGAFAGHFVNAHRQATELAEQVMVVPIPAQADILIVSANPCYTDYWQGIKAFVYAQAGVREGGIMILLLDGVEGLCGDAPSHEETVREYLLQSFEEQKRAVEGGRVHDLVGLNVPMYHAMVRHRVARTICVSPNLSKEDIAAMGFTSAPDVQAALAQAHGALGMDATVGVIPYGGETLVRVVGR